jgi:hypothetical protein
MTPAIRALANVLSANMRRCFLRLAAAWEARPDGANFVSVTYDEFASEYDGEPGVRRAEVKSALDRLIDARLLERADGIKRGRGRPRNAYRLTPLATGDQSPSTPVPRDTHLRADRRVQDATEINDSK